MRDTGGHSFQYHSVSLCLSIYTHTHTLTHMNIPYTYIALFFLFHIILQFIFIHLIFFLTYILEKEMATHSRTLSWKTPWMEEPGRLQPMG